MCLSRAAVGLALDFLLFPLFTVPPNFRTALALGAYKIEEERRKEKKKRIQALCELPF